MIQFTTNLPEFTADLYDVIRLFYGNTPISPDEGEMRLLHEHSEQDGQWLESARYGAEKNSVLSYHNILNFDEQKYENMHCRLLYLLYLW